MPTYFRGAAAVLLLGSVASVGHAGELDDLLRYLPESANTITVLNIKTIRQLSGRGGDAPGQEIVAGMIVPGVVDGVVYATHLAPGELESRKTGGVIRLNKAVTLDDVSDKTRGTVTSLGGLSVVSHPTRGYYALLKPDVLGFARQVTRQELAKWLQFTRTNQKVVIAPFLTHAVEAAGDAPIVWAMDTEEMFDPKALAARLAATKTMDGLGKEAVADAAAVVAGLRGVTLTVRGKDLRQAEARLEFAAPVGDRGDLLKALFLEALDDFGARLDEFRSAPAKAAGNALVMDVKLSDDGLIRIMSMFMPPTPPAVSSAPPKLESNGVSLVATRRYYLAVAQMIDDLSRKSKNTADYNKSAAWHDTFAKRIEELPTQYVDSDMVKYGANQTAKLRALSYSLRGMIVQVNALESGMSYITNFGGGGWWGGGGGSTDSNVAALRAQQAEAVAKDGARRLEIWESTDQDRRAILKLMNDRYHVDLERPIR